jgi:2'-5' RNA ligase
MVGESDGVAVPPRNFHLTLAFLGAVTETRIADLSAVAARVAAASASVLTSPIAITLDRIDYWRKAQVLCATASLEPAEATALAETLKAQLTANGFAPDLKPFRTHATLARKVRRVTRERHMPSVLWSFQNFHLVESHTAPTGAIYSSREIYPLDAHAR